MYLLITLDGVAFRGTQGSSAASVFDPAEEVPEGFPASFIPAKFRAIWVEGFGFIGLDRYIGFPINVMGSIYV